jgi:DME family drug/metabolite transporter
LLLKERPRRSDGPVLLVAMIGVAIIFGGHGSHEAPALLIGLTSGLGYGSLTVALRGLRRVDPRTVVALNFLGSGLLLVPAVAIWARVTDRPMGDLFLMSAYPFVLMLVLSIVQLALPYLLFSWALRRVEAHRAALILLLEAVLNPVATFLVVGEMVPTATLVGGPLILLSVVGWMMLTWRRGRPRKSSLRPIRSRVETGQGRAGSSQ